MLTEDHYHECPQLLGELVLRTHLLREVLWPLRSQLLGEQELSFAPAPLQGLEQKQAFLPALSQLLGEQELGDLPCWIGRIWEQVCGPAFCFLPF